MVNIKRLKEIDWSSYEHAKDTPKYLIDLFSNDREKVKIAISKLEDMLHGHIWAVPALLPAFPFFVEALQTLTEAENLGPLLEFFWGISRATLPTDHFYSIRALDLSWTSIPGKPSVPTESHVQEIRKLLLLNRKLFPPFLNHRDDWIFESAAALVTNFAETPAETSTELQNALLREDNPGRRHILFYGLRELFFENKADYLVQAFHKETNPSIKSEVAAQIAYEMKTDSPPEVVKLLSELVVDMSMSEIEKQSELFFTDIGIPLALARPDTYEDVLERFIHCMKQQTLVDKVTELLAFAFCWNGKPDFDNLNSLQVGAIEAVYQKTWHGAIVFTSYDFRYFSLPTDPDEIKARFLDRKPK